MKPASRRWPMLLLVLAPLGLAFLWCAFIDQEAFGAFVLGVLFSSVFGAVALIASLVRYVRNKAAKATRP